MQTQPQLPRFTLVFFVKLKINLYNYRPQSGVICGQPKPREPQVNFSMFSIVQREPLVILVFFDDGTDFNYATENTVTVDRWRTN